MSRIQSDSLGPISSGHLLNLKFPAGLDITIVGQGILDAPRANRFPSWTWATADEPTLRRDLEDPIRHFDHGFRLGISAGGTIINQDSALICQQEIIDGINKCAAHGFLITIVIRGCGQLQDSFGCHVSVR